MKNIFLFRDEILNDDLLVYIGKDEKRLFKWVEKHASKEAKKTYKDNLDLIKNGLESAGCLTMLVRDDKHAIYLLSLRDWKNDWEHLETLVHEITHYKQFQFKNRRIGNEELEFEAYFIENTFRQLREKLNS